MRVGSKTLCDPRTTMILWLFFCGCTVNDVAIPQGRGPAPPSPAADASAPVVPDASVLGGRSDSRPDSSLPPDVTADLQPDLTGAPDLMIDLSSDAFSPTDGSLATVDASSSSPDLGSDTIHRDLGVPDASPKKSLGIRCGNPSQCSSGFCTDGVCCVVALCRDDCVPSAINNCPVYEGWTCAPGGTCRAY